MYPLFLSPNGKTEQYSNIEALDNPHVYLWELYRKVGDMIPEVTSSLCRSGHLIVTERTPERAIELADRLLSEVKMETI